MKLIIIVANSLDEPNRPSLRFMDCFVRTKVLPRNDDIKAFCDYDEKKGNFMNRKLNTPQGVRDYLPDELFLKNEVQRAVEAVFLRYGYSRLSGPAYEYAEVFEDCESSAYKFVGSGGAVLVLRPEMTPSIARIAATSYKKEDIPLRFCYFEKAFRHNRNYQGKLNEFTQAGVELIGVNNREADAEVIACAVHSLIACGAESFRVDIGHSGFFFGIAEHAEKNMLKKLIEEKDYVSLCEAADELDLSDGVRTIFREYPFLIGGMEVLERVRLLVDNDVALAAVADMERVYQILCCYGLQRYVAFDFSLTSRLDYYTGVIFRGYANGAPVPVIDGGRYDNLAAKFGADYPAVGFAIEIDALAAANPNTPHRLPLSKTLAAYSEGGMETALKTVTSMRRRYEVVIEMGTVGHDLDANIEYAKRRGFGGLFYFKDTQKILVVNIKTGGRKEVEIFDLLGGGLF